MTGAPRADILIVDDVPANLEVLSAILKTAGYKVRPVPNGKLAVRAATSAPPDLVLMDIEMPEMGGYEACRLLKSDSATAAIPVIFLSALTDADDKVKAFAAGGVDYVTKPFQAEEVLARVETHVGISRLQRQLESQFRELQRLEGMRDSLTHMIVHDLRSPLAAIIGNLDLMDEDPSVAASKSVARLHGAKRSAASLLQMIGALLDVNKMEAGEMALELTDGDLAAVAQRSVDALGTLAGDRQVVVDAAGAVPCRVDGALIARVIENLLGNAFRYSPGKSTVTVRAVARNDRARIEVRDTGRGIPEEFRERIFQKFGRVEGVKQHAHSTGLGLAFCKLAVEAHGGVIGVDSEVGKGSTFWFELPNGGSAPAVQA
jgi:two-component system sensor histidine kinase/response regulator